MIMDGDDDDADDDDNFRTTILDVIDNDNFRATIGSSYDWHPSVLEPNTLLLGWRQNPGSYFAGA